MHAAAFCVLAVLACAALTARAQTCTVCGEVRSVREVGAPKSATGSAAPLPQADVGTSHALDTPMVVGTVARFEFDQGRAESWHLGAAGTPDMKRLGEVYYEITVLMDGGERRTLQRRDGNRFHVGQRVALRSGELEPM